MTENTALTRVSIYTTSRIELESDDFFDHFTGLRWIYIKYLLSREPPSFKKLLSLQHLYLGLVGSNTHTFDDTIVNGLSNLYSLTLYSSYFNRITKGAFGNLNRLYILSIANSKITYIEDGVFTDLPSLQTLYLDNTELSNISNNIFEGLSRLTYLSVSQNPGFPISVLLQTRNLVRIDLNYNEYQTLDPYVFQQMKQLTDLGLSDPFLCDCNLQWISVIKQFGISIGAGQSPFCFQPFKFQQTHIYDTSVYSNCSQSHTYQCFDKSITCPSNLVCHNTNISYTCGCPIGYELNVSGNCIDVNECDKVTNCQYSCVNTEGSFYCICDKGYKLASNGYACGEENECHECTSEPNLSTVQSESSLTIPLILLTGISLPTNLVSIIIIIALVVYIMRKNNGKGHGNPKHMAPEIQAIPHSTNEFTLLEIPNDASLTTVTTTGFHNQDTQDYPVTINEENAIYENLK